MEEIPAESEEIEDAKKEGVIIKIQKSRKEPIEIIQIEKDQEISEFAQIIKNAYEEIR